jgi:hypothetical protein
MEALVYLSVRTIFGMSLASLLGAVGFLAVLFVWSPSWEPSYLAILQVSASGLGAGMGGFLGWLRTDEGRATVLVTLALALAGGMAGAWGGLAYARIVYGEEPFHDPARLITVLGAAVAANVSALAVNLYWILRGRKL